MKPNFALGLTKDGITLWQRGGSGWLRVGAVPVDAPAMDAQMRDLAKVAKALAPEGVRTKLVVPDEQILFCNLPVAARSREMQAHEIRAQLADRTPYPVEELDFDWTIENGTAQVAVVARETAIEAEDFASLYGLNPVSVVAAPEGATFSQEPFFGTTRRARDILGDPATLERDRDILRETGTVTLPDPELVAEKKAQPAVEKSSEVVEPKAPDGPKESATTAPSPTADKPAAPASEATGAKAPDSAVDKAPKDAAKEPAQKPAPAVPTGKGEAVDTRKAALLSKLKAAKADSDSANAPSSSGASVGLTALLGTRQKPDIAPPPAPVSQDGTSGDASPAFRSRRASAAPDPKAPAPQSDTSPKRGKDLLGALRARMGARPGLSKLSFGGFGKALSVAKVAGAARGASATPAPPSVSAAPTSGAPKTGGAFNSGGVAPTSSAPKTGPVPDKDRAVAWTPDAKRVAAKPDAGKPVSKAGYDKSSSPKTGNSNATARKGPIDTLHAHGASGGKQSEAERMTIFGARNRDEPEASPARRAILILGGVALLLVAVAVWVFYFTASEPAPQSAQDLNPVVEPSPLLSELDDAVAGGAEPAQDDIEAALGLEDAAQQPPIDAAEPDFAQATEASPQMVPQASVEDQSAGRVAGLRSSTLLAPQDATPLPAAPSAPAPFGADPLPPLREDVEAAAALAETPPEGPGIDEAPAEAPAEPSLPAGEEALEIVVTEGAPPVTPPAKPVELAADVATESTPDADPAATDAATPDPLDESDLVIVVTQGSPPVTPPARPAGLTPEPPASAEPAEITPDAQTQPIPEALEEPGADQASLDTLTPGGVALTALRPASRPVALAEAAAVAAATPAFDATELAVPASVRPGARPGQFAAVVQRALRAAQPRTQTQTPAVVAAAPAPEPQAPVQTARAAVPAAPVVIPASASVAREATQARAIDLRQINLIGVMGTSSSRRALVRLSNGRVVAVRVGEQLDGGQVTAIGENELRYMRRGRDVVLRIAS